MEGSRLAPKSGGRENEKNKEGMSANFKLGSKHRILPLPDTSSRQGAQTVVIVYRPIESRLLEAAVCQHDGLQPLSVLQRRGGRMREVHRP